MMISPRHIFCFGLVLFLWQPLHAQNATQTGIAPAAVDSMVYYNSTKKPEISDSKYIEYGPTIQADGKTIIFSANPNGKRYSLFQSTQTDGFWSSPVELSTINSKGDSLDLVGGPSISFDGSMLYYFRSVWDSVGPGNKRTNEEIFYSLRQKDTWSDPIRLGPPINTPDYEGFPSISADGSTLYFVRQNKEGPRDRDLRKEGDFCTCIYSSVKDINGNWSKPTKLPWPINQDCEKAPRIMADGRTLIFSSNRPGGKGGFDMYQTKLNDLNEWTQPIPLDFVNTEFDDQLPCISAEGDKMFYTYLNNDIYSVTIPYAFRQFMNNIVQGYITDQDSNEGVAAKIVVSDAQTSENVMVLDNNPSDGRYTIVLPVGRSFNIEYIKDGYSSYTTFLDLTMVKKYQELTENVKLFKTVRLNLSVNDKEIFEPIQSDINIRLKGENKIYKNIKNNTVTGRVIAELPVGNDYEIIVTSPNFKSEIIDFNISGLILYRDFVRNVELMPEKKEVMVNVSDIQNNSKVKSKVVIKNKTRDEVIEVQGNQMVSLRSGDRYEIEVTSDQGYAFDSRSLDLTSGAVATVDIQLVKLEKNANLELKDINFESNSAVLTEISFIELGRLIQLLNENPNLNVEIAAHTDDVGSESYNLVLSEKRAKSVAEYLKQKNIPESRFRSKGYGESVSKVPNNSDENRAINRRVVLKVLSI